ncbi:MAG TPA: ATP-binding protein [Bryobacteraceae bacterium]|nr:ATP-binding protein [Bryobacteraceae bacterium]
MHPPTMEMLEQNMPAGSQAAEREWMAKLREARDLTERTILEMRRLIAALSPAVLEQLGLGAALRQLLNRFRRLHPCRMKLQMYKLEALPQQSQIIVYRLVQECCNNIGKHSGANQVNICVHFADGVLRLYVEDNGAGFNVGEALSRHGSFGLSGMRERVALLRGKFQVESRTEGPKRGTKISVGIADIGIGRSLPCLRGARPHKRLWRKLESCWRTFTHCSARASAR